MQTKREPDISSKFDDSGPLFIDQYLLFFSSYDLMAVSLLRSFSS